MNKTNDSLENRQFLIIGCVLFALFCIFTCALLKVDAEAIGPNGSIVGFSALNGSFKKLFSFNELYKNLSDVLGYVAIILAFVFTGGCFFSGIKKKNLLKRVNPFLVLSFLYAITVVLYIIFDKVIVINYRPILMNGVLEPSYPSSHTLLGLVVYLSLSILAKKNKKDIFSSICVVLAILICVFRCLSGVHWFTDIVGSVILSLSLINFFKAFIL